MEHAEVNRKIAGLFDDPTNPSWSPISGLCAENIAFRPLLARRSPAAKILFRRGQADRKSARGEFGVGLGIYASGRGSSCLRC